MAKNVRLYDIRKKKYPQNGSFRTLQVFECWVCGGLTNKMYAGAYIPRGYHEETVCPNGRKCWHHELELKLQWSEKPHPKAYKEALILEIEALKKIHAKKVKNNLVGNPDIKLKKPVSRTFPGDFICEHLFSLKHW